MGATVETITNVIRHRLGNEEMARLVAKYGLDTVEWHLSYTGSFFEGVEEIGSSDAWHMVDAFVRGLGEPSVFKD